MFCQTEDFSQLRCSDDRSHRNIYLHPLSAQQMQIEIWPTLVFSAQAWDLEKLKRKDTVIKIWNVLTSIRECWLMDTNTDGFKYFQCTHFQNWSQRSWSRPLAQVRWYLESPLSSLWNTHIPGNVSAAPADPGTSTSAHPGLIALIIQGNVCSYWSPIIFYKKWHFIAALQNIFIICLYIFNHNFSPNWNVQLKCTDD